MLSRQPATINVDFDGTCVGHEFPDIGPDIGAVPVLQALTRQGHRVILFTMRSGKTLGAAVEWFIDNKIPLYGIQTNPTQSEWTQSPKSYAKVMIDDSAVGCPLKSDPSVTPRPFVDWKKVSELLKDRGLLPHYFNSKEGV